MKERKIQPKKTTADSFSIPALRQPIPGFGSESSGASSQPAVDNPLVHDISRIPLRSPQAKLTINQPGDIYEQQADTVAQDVVGRLEQLGNHGSIQRQQMPQEEELQMKPLATDIMSLVQREEIPEEEEEELQTKSLDNSTLQRESLPEEEEEELQTKSLDNSTLQRESLPDEEEEELQTKSLDDSTLQRESLPEEEEEELQTKSLDNSTLQRESLPEEEEEELQMSPMVQRQATAGMAANPNLEASINQAKSSGQAMDDKIREPMEQAFGADFSGVKVHTDAQSDELNQSIQARAFTTGEDVFFRQGEYNPDSRGGQELLAHELTHVVQQSEGTVQRIQSQRIEQNSEDATQVQMQTLADGQELVIQAAPDLILQLTQCTSNNLTNHFNKHSSERNFSYTDEADYAQAAIDFVDNPASTTQMKTLSDGSTVYYDPTTDNFASVASNGNIKTFFQPGRGNNAAGQRYFNKLT